MDVRQPRSQKVFCRVVSAITVSVLVLASLVFAGTTRAFAHTPHDSIVDLEVSPAFEQDATVYTISRERLLKSSDRGDTWTRLVRGLDNAAQLSAVEVSTQDPRDLYAASFGDGVFRSVDGGESWAPTSGLETSDIGVLAVSPHSSEIVFAAGRDNGLFRTQDGGVSWMEVTGIRAEHVTAIAFAPDLEGMVLVGDGHGTLELSQDGGNNWRRVGLPSENAGDVRAIAVSPNFSRDSTFFVGMSGGVFKSDDAGASFTDITDGIDDRRIVSLFVSSDFAADSTLWAVTWTSGVFRSEDGGESWVTANAGLTTNAQADFLEQPHFGEIRASAGTSSEDPTMFVAGFDGLFRSVNAGDRWRELRTQSPSAIQSLAVSPSYARDKSLAVTTYINGVFLSEDAGAHFTAINHGLADRVAWLREPDYVARLMGTAFSPTYPDDDTLFGSGRGYWFVSANRGASWRATTPPGIVNKNEFPPDYFLSAFSPAYADDDTVILGTDGGKVFRSTDGGSEFAKVSDLGVEISSIVVSPDFASDRTVVAGTPDGVFMSTDAGDSWSPAAELQAPTSIAVSPGYRTDNTLFAGTPRGLFSSPDRGASWRQVTVASVGDKFVESVVVSPDYTSDGTVLVSIRGHGLFKSTDGGETYREVGDVLLQQNYQLAAWYHPISEPIVFSPAYATDHTVFGFAESHVFVSTDGAESWHELEVPVTVHETTADAAPGGLLSTPRYSNEHPSLRVRLARFRNDLDLSTIGVLAALGAGLVVFAALSALHVFDSSRRKHLMRGVCAVGALVAALAVLSAT